mmetsp:Transcript_6851/g.12896  ORF Transcript_6851/g.12896 Transcript_6851/m.12896 type:complete len:189 (+) Transcript_6851:415-981(+)
MNQQQQQSNKGQYSSTLRDWEDVHRQLSLAVLMTQDAIYAEKEKRRLLLEEIFHNVLPDGNLKKDSKWRQQRRRISEKSVETENEQLDEGHGLTHDQETTACGTTSGHDNKVDADATPQRTIMDEASTMTTTTTTTATTTNEKNNYFTGSSEELFRTLLQEQGSDMKGNRNSTDNAFDVVDDESMDGF